MYAEASGDPPEGSKHVKAQEWLRNTNKQHSEPLSVLGKIICGYMEDPEMAADHKVEAWQTESEYTLKKRDLVRKIDAVLARNALQYRTGGYLTGGGLAPSKKLGELIPSRYSSATISPLESGRTKGFGSLRGSSKRECLRPVRSTQEGRGV